VIPKWAAAIFAGEAVYINGDGLTSRDFCFVANAVQANLLAGAVDDATAVNQVYNVAVGDQTDLNRLHAMLLAALQAQRPGLAEARGAPRVSGRVCSAFTGGCGEGAAAAGLCAQP